MARSFLFTIVAAAAFVASALAPSLVSAATAPSTATAAATVTISDFHFVPKNLTVHAGTTVKWVNNQVNIPHSTVSDTGLWDSGPLGNGKTFSRTFRRVGTFYYHCHLQTTTKHMLGSITVLP
jgi:plastocyanin